MAASESPWRLFVAVPIGDEMRATLEDAVSELRTVTDPTAWRWTEPEGWHVTLLFLGSTQPEAIPSMTDALASLGERHEPFTLDGGRYGAFPSTGRARVLWYGFDDGDRRLSHLANSVRAALGADPEARFRSHVTLARSRARYGRDASSVLGVHLPPSSRLHVDRVILYRSHVGRGPARYEALADVPLVGAS